MRESSRGNPTFGFPLPHGTPFLFPFPEGLSAVAVQCRRINSNADERVRQAPEKAYTPEFYKSFTEEVGWKLG